MRNRKTDLFQPKNRDFSIFWSTFPRPIFCDLSSRKKMIETCPASFWNKFRPKRRFGLEKVWYLFFDGPESMSKNEKNADGLEWVEISRNKNIVFFLREKGLLPQWQLMASMAETSGKQSFSVEEWTVELFRRLAWKLWIPYRRAFLNSKNLKKFENFLSRSGSSFYGATPIAQETGTFWKHGF